MSCGSGCPPLLFLVFNRPGQTARVFEAIARARPAELYIAADGPRVGHIEDAKACAEVRKIVEGVNWDCEVKTLMREQNLGCRDAVSTAIGWFFSHVEEGIILEDDCLPSDCFFSYCKQLLETHRQDERVMMVSGNSYRPEYLGDCASYYYSRLPRVWGWASWRRAWSHYDVDMGGLADFLKGGAMTRLWEDPDIRAYWTRKLLDTRLGRINTWDFQWYYAIWRREAMVARPAVNLIENLGMDENATHTTAYNERLALSRGTLGKVVHPGERIIDEEADLHENLHVECATFHHVSNPLQRWRKRLRQRWKVGRRISRWLDGGK